MKQIYKNGVLTRVPVRGRYVTMKNGKLWFGMKCLRELDSSHRALTPLELKNGV